MDTERIERVRHVLHNANLDALVCALPSNVRLLSGYWPVVGASIGLFTREGAIGLIVPEDELDFSNQGWAGEIQSFVPASLDNLRPLDEILREPVGNVCRLLGMRGACTIGVERGGEFDPATYAANFIWGGTLQKVFELALPNATFRDATTMLSDLKSVLTGGELDDLRKGCAIAARAFSGTAAELRPGMREAELASQLRHRLNPGIADGRRVGGFAWCMSGPNSARAYAAYQLTTERVMETGDLVLLHCNSYYAGMWTDITRTFSLEPQRYKPIRRAVDEASEAAIAAVRPGVEACTVDRAARNVMNAHGLGKQFRHATGHGVGFAAINHNAKPRIHPLSHDRLEPGMVFNIEPAAYLEGMGGLRHCDMVAVTGSGAELLTKLGPSLFPGCVSDPF